jgi:hypothetical protein
MSIAPTRPQHLDAFRDPCGRIAQPWLALEQFGDIGRFEANRGIRCGALESSVVFRAWRHDQDIGGPHVERPMGHAIFGVQQHADHKHHRTSI